MAKTNITQKEVKESVNKFKGHSIPEYLQYCTDSKDYDCDMNMITKKIFSNAHKDDLTRLIFIIEANIYEQYGREPKLGQYYTSLLDNVQKYADIYLKEGVVIEEDEIKSMTIEIVESDVS